MPVAFSLWAYFFTAILLTRLNKLTEHPCVAHLCSITLLNNKYSPAVVRLRSECALAKYKQRSTSLRSIAILG